MSKQNNVSLTGNAPKSGSNFWVELSFSHYSNFKHYQNLNLDHFHQNDNMHDHLYLMHCLKIKIICSRSIQWLTTHSHTLITWLNL